MLKLTKTSNEGKWINVKCNKCGNTQTIYGKATTVVKCINCSTILATPTGGKAKIKARVLKIK
ncbi:MAG: 30S ribosomal protein S27e [Candidatus Pacearchaeota archaeon]